MPTSISVTYDKINEKLDEVETWLQKHVGPGSRRYNTNTWLGTDDWFCYELTEPKPDYIDSAEDYELKINFVFSFRRETDATFFTLQWL